MKFTFDATDSGPAPVCESKDCGQEVSALDELAILVYYCPDNLLIEVTTMHRRCADREVGDLGDWYGAYCFLRD